MTMAINDVVITCCHDSCGISFAVPQWWHKGKCETHSTFFCPNGHPQSFRSETETEKMRRERDRALQDVARAEEEAAIALRAKDKSEREVRRMKKRASAGTCPCCQRMFSNMAEHIKKQHPDFIREGGANVVTMKVRDGK